MNLREPPGGSRPFLPKTTMLENQTKAGGERPTIEVVVEPVALPRVPEERPHFCPSAQPTEGAFVFGVVEGDVGAPRVSYLDEKVPVTDELLAMAAPVRPSEVFRIAAPCATHACQHYDGKDCQLATKLVQLTPPVTDTLPACQVRPDCRWWRQEGKVACMVCPGVRTQSFNVSEDRRRATDPAFRIVKITKK
jgi:hypothetical protein